MSIEIKSYNLDNRYLFVHKEATIDSDFGLDNTNELIDNGFGLYSSARVKDRIGPLRSEFYRIALCRKGFVTIDCGLETFVHHKNTIHFNFPSQLFSLYDKSEDMFAYYILFTEEFISDHLPLNNISKLYPFLDYDGIPFIELEDNEAKEIEELFFKIDNEIKRNEVGRKQAIQLYINLILLSASRSYKKQNLSKKVEPRKDLTLITRFKKLVSQHFLTKRNVSDYATMLAVTPNHLNKISKEQTGKTASSFIEAMLLMESKALLKHSNLAISEIAYKLEFTDPSHFNKFFKKHTNHTPLQFRNL